MATTDTRNQPIERRLERQEDRDSRTLWTVIALVIIAVLAYAAYTSYYTPAEPVMYDTSASNNAADTTTPAPATSDDSTPTSPTVTQ